MATTMSYELTSADVFYERALEVLNRCTLVDRESGKGAVQNAILELRKVIRDAFAELQEIKSSKKDNELAILMVKDLLHDLMQQRDRLISESSQTNKDAALIEINDILKDVNSNLRQLTAANNSTLETLTAAVQDLAASSTSTQSASSIIVSKLKDLRTCLLIVGPWHRTLEGEPILLAAALTAKVQTIHAEGKSDCFTWDPQRTEKQHTPQVLAYLKRYERPGYDWMSSDELGVAKVEIRKKFERCSFPVSGRTDYILHKLGFEPALGASWIIDTKKYVLDELLKSLRQIEVESYLFGDASEFPIIATLTDFTAAISVCFEVVEDGRPKVNIIVSRWSDLLIAARNSGIVRDGGGSGDGDTGGSGSGSGDGSGEGSGDSYRLPNLSKFAPGFPRGTKRKEHDYDDQLMQVRFRMWELAQDYFEAEEELEKEEEERLRLDPIAHVAAEENYP